jgi:threonine dehydratase
VLLKLECWQPTGSYKVRGALSFLAGLPPDARARGVVAASAGNHALGVAFAAAALGLDSHVTLFVPATAPRAKLDKLRTYPVEVREVGTTYDDAHREAAAFAKETGAAFADPVENLAVAAGHGTLGLELLDQRPDLAAVVVPVGGGALVTGVATALKARAPRVRVVAVQSEASPALVESLRLGRALVEYAAAPTLADGLAGGIGELVFRHRHLLDEAVTVPEAEIAAAMAALLADDQVVAEGAGAAAAAAILAGRVRADGPVAVLVTGANVDASVLARIVRTTR